MNIYYGQSKFRAGGFQFRRSTRLATILTNRLGSRRSQFTKEAVIEVLTEIVLDFGFILPNWYAPKEKEISFSDFADTITATYSVENAKTRYAVEFLKELSVCAI